MPNNYGMSYHIIVDGLDQNQLDSVLLHLIQLQPSWINVTGGSRLREAMQFVERVRTACPDINVIFRNYSMSGLKDNGISSKLSPEQWYAIWVVPMKSWLQTWKVYYMTDNEGFVGGEAMRGYADWMARVIKLCYPDRIKLAVGRMPTGIPDWPDYIHLVEMFKALANYGGIWSPNEYFGQTPQLSNSLPGRFFTALKMCDDLGIKRPVVVLGEYGVAYAKLGMRGEIVLDPDKGYTTLGWSQEKLFDQAVSYFEPWIQIHGVCVCLFAIGAINEYVSFAFDEPLMKRNLEYKRQGKGIIPAVTTQPPTNPPKETQIENGLDFFDYRWEIAEISSKGSGGVNVRIRPNTTNNTPIGLVKEKKQGFVASDPSWGKWVQVRYENLFGWCDVTLLDVVKQGAFVSIPKVDYDGAIEAFREAERQLAIGFEKLT